MGGRSAVAVAAVLWLGCLFPAPEPVFALLVFTSLALALTALVARAPRRTSHLLLMLAVLLAASARAEARHQRLAMLSARLPPDGSVVGLDAILVEPPRREGGEPIAIVRVVASDAVIAPGSRVRLRMPEATTAEWGDTVRAMARLERPGPRRQPGGFDGAAAARALDVIANGRALTLTVRPDRGLLRAPVAVAMRLRRASERALAAGMPLRTRELAAPLLFGDRTAMDPGLDASLRATGLVHLLALSGLHVAWMAAVARGLAALAGAGLRGRAVIGACCALFYVLLAGPVPSLMRAAATEWVRALAAVTARSLDAVQGLAVAALVLLLVFPGWSDDLGFQLSCAATLGLVCFTSPIAAALARTRLPRAACEALAATLAAQLLALPLLLVRFHALPWTGVAANLVAVPLAEGLLLAGWIGAVADVVLPGSGAVWFAACRPLADGVRAASQWGAALPFAQLPAGSGGAAALAAAGGIAVLLATVMPPRAALASPPARRRRVGLVLGGSLVGCALLAVLTEPERRPPPGSWWLVALDVGQGDALLMATPEGWWLIDSGPRSPRWDAGEGAVLPMLRWAAVRRLTDFVLTHDDGDHTGGAQAVRRAMAVGRMWVPGATHGAGDLRDRHPDARGVSAGDTLRRAAPRVIVEWPPRERESVAERGDNAAALVLRLEQGGHVVRLMADVDSLVEEALGPRPLWLLKAGHHGSASSTGTRWLMASSPARVLVSCGRRNRYGHPAPRVLASAARAGARVDRTDHDGAVAYRFGPGGPERLPSAWHLPRAGATRHSAGAVSATRCW